MIDVLVSQAKSAPADNTTNIKLPSRIEYPNLKAEKKGP